MILSKVMAIKFDAKLLVGGFILLAFLGGIAMATPRGSGRGGFDDYGYNENAEVFMGCLDNYNNWKLNRPATECTDIDLQVHANWRFDSEGDLDWLINLLYSPVSGDHVLKRYVTISQEACIEAGGRWFNLQKVTQTGELVPVCQITEIVLGEGPTLVATPAGFGIYKDE